MLELRDMFQKMLEADASDLHIVVGAPPQLRVRGDLRNVEGYGQLSAEDTRELIFGVLTNEQRQKLETQWEIDFSYAVPGMSRWRVNAFYQQGSVGAAFRIIPEKIRPLSDLSVPDSVYALANLPRGLVLVTGPTGSGKSTTLAGMIDVINEQRHEHILTVEDPIEFIHQHKNCIVNQREVGADTDGFARALKSALRQDPDVILVGEMRDLETIQTALTAAETGHLVFGTLHTNSAAKTVDRVIDVFPPHQQAQVRVQLASSLQGVITQSLVPTRDGRGRVVACEVMIPNGAIRNLIREGKIFQIPSVMQTSQGEGMQTLDAALATLVRTNQITRDEAIKRAHEPEEFNRLLDNGGGAPTPGRNLYKRPEVIRLQRAIDPGRMGGSMSDMPVPSFGDPAGGLVPPPMPDFGGAGGAAPVPMPAEQGYAAPAGFAPPGTDPATGQPFAFPDASSFGAPTGAPTMEFAQPGAGHGAPPQEFAPQYADPSQGYAPAPGAEYAAPPGTGYAPTPGAEYAQAPGAEYAPMPGAEYAQPPGGEYAPAPAMDYGQPAAELAPAAPALGYAQDPHAGAAAEYAAPTMYPAPPTTHGVPDFAPPPLPTTPMTPPDAQYAPAAAGVDPITGQPYHLPPGTGA